MWMNFVEFNLVLGFLFLVSSHQALQLQSDHLYQNKSVPSAALFFVLLERAHDLPVRLLWAWSHTQLLQLFYMMELS